MPELLRPAPFALTATRLFAEQSAAQQRAIVAAQRIAELSLTRYEASFVRVLDVIAGAPDRLVAERTSVQLQGRRFVLGGGRDSSALVPLAVLER